VRKYVGTILSWTGGLLLIVSVLSALFTAPRVLSSQSNRLGFLLVVLAEIVGFFVGRGIFNAGRRIAQEPAAVRLATDHRPPVLLLRAFGADGEVAERNWFTQRSLFGWMFGRASFEEQLATIMENLGPAVALGRSGEVLPEYGFAREYADNSTWRGVVDNYLSRSSWVVILLQELTPNLIYEVHRSLTSGSPLKVLLIPPPHRFRTAAWQAAWASLTASLPMLPRVTDLTAAIVIDPKEGVFDISMPTRRSANAQLSAIQRALIPKYLVPES
jgi:hypothetical protein